MTRITVFTTHQEFIEYVPDNLAPHLSYKVEDGVLTVRGTKDELGHKAIWTRVFARDVWAACSSEHDE